MLCGSLDGRGEWIHVYVCICICIYMYMCVYVYMYVFLYVYVYMYMYVYVCLSPLAVHLKLSQHHQSAIPKYKIKSLKKKKEELSIPLNAL